MAESKTSATRQYLHGCVYRMWYSLPGAYSLLGSSIRCFSDWKVSMKQAYCSRHGRLRGGGKGKGQGGGRMGRRSGVSSWRAA